MPHKRAELRKTAHVSTYTLQMRAAVVVLDSSSHLALTATAKQMYKRFLLDSRLTNDVQDGYARSRVPGSRFTQLDRR
jgi:hypothetical protein